MCCRLFEQFQHVIAISGIVASDQIQQSAFLCGKAVQYGAPLAETKHPARQIPGPAFGNGKLRQHLVLLIIVVHRAGQHRYGCIGFGNLEHGRSLVRMRLLRRTLGKH